MYGTTVTEGFWTRENETLLFFYIHLQDNKWRERTSSEDSTRLGVRGWNLWCVKLTLPPVRLALHPTTLLSQVTQVLSGSLFLRHPGWRRVPGGPTGVSTSPVQGLWWDELSFVRPVGLSLLGPRRGLVFLVLDRLSLLQDVWGTPRGRLCSGGTTVTGTGKCQRKVGWGRGDEGPSG